MCTSSAASLGLWMVPPAPSDRRLSRSPSRSSLSSLSRLELSPSAEGAGFAASSSLALASAAAPVVAGRVSAQAPKPTCHSSDYCSADYRSVLQAADRCCLSSKAPLIRAALLRCSPYPAASKEPAAGEVAGHRGRKTAAAVVAQKLQERTG